eukprot:Pompholyxophrys_punicea_v1_NODE_595_length_1623_cov_2.719388.p3 type:complete len:119 gc:universal NODE_595_length_1623_cov_2.719388:663-307(-)
MPQTISIKFSSQWYFGTHKTRWPRWFTKRSAIGISLTKSSHRANASTMSGSFISGLHKPLSLQIASAPRRPIFWVFPCQIVSRISGCLPPGPRFICDATRASGANLRWPLLWSIKKTA